MTAEKRPTMFIVVAKGMKPISICDLAQEHMNDSTECPYIYMEFDSAKDIALKYYNKFGISCEIMMLSSLTGAITPESLDSPMLDYVPQRIMRIENADQLGEMVNDLEVKLTKATKRINDLEEENQDQHHGLEEAGKLMELLRDLGNLMDKAEKEK